MYPTSRIAHTKRRFAPRPLATLAITACAAAGMIGLAAPAATAAPPPNQAARSAVGLAFDSAGSGFAFYRGLDNAVYMRTFFGTGFWGPQSSVGGAIVGAPAAAVAAGNVVVAARGTDNAMYLRTMHNGTWAAHWTNLGGVLTSSPAVTGGSDGRIDVFVRGADNALWTRTLTAGGTLKAWKSLGGKLAAAPAAVAVADNSFEIVVTGVDNVVWGYVGPNWTSLGGRTFDAPAIAQIPESNGGYVLIRGVDDALWVNGFGGGDSTGWKSLGGTLIDNPTAAGTRAPTPHVIAAFRDSAGAVWTTTPTAGTDTGWSEFTPTWFPEGK